MDAKIIAERKVSTVVIPNGTSVSGSVDTGVQGVLVGFIAPAAWTTAALNLEVSPDNATWVTAGLFDDGGSALSSWAAVTAGAGYSVNSAAMLPWRYFRFRSGTAASATNQGADRIFTVITRPLA